MAHKTPSAQQVELLRKMATGRMLVREPGHLAPHRLLGKDGAGAENVPRMLTSNMVSQGWLMLDTGASPFVYRLTAKAEQWLDTHLPPGADV